VKIAAVHGFCLGGGMELATFCDCVVATESAQFGQPEIKLGCFPPVALVTLPNLIGMRAAADLILTGRQISAAEAQRLGLITRVVSDSELRHQSELIEKFARVESQCSSADAQNLVEPPANSGSNSKKWNAYTYRD
jgi:enoyl-CoA hydratase/carnithine racemase